MSQKIKTKKGFIQIPLLVAIIVSIVAAAGIGYGVVEYNKTSNLVKESQQLAKEEKYNEAIDKLESAKSGWATNVLGVKKQEIVNEIENNKKLLEDKSEYAQGMEEFNKGNWEKAKELLSKVSEASPYYQDAKNKIEEAQKKITGKQIAEAVEKTTEMTQEEMTKLQLERQKAEKQWAEAEIKLKVEGLFRIGNTLQDYYNIVREGRGVGQNWWLYGYQGEVDFASYLAKHGIGAVYWQEYESTYHSLTGSSSWLDAKEKLDNVLFLPYTAAVSYNESDYEKIRKILDFFKFYIKYEPDFNEILRAPAETLGLKSGDCDDWSILASAAFADVGIDSAIMFVKSVDGTQAHAMVLVQSKETLPLWSYSDLTQFDLPSGRWWIIEPQFTFEEHQQNPEWFAKWRIAAAALVKGIKNTIGGARAETKDAAVKASMDSMRLACEMFWVTNRTYTACNADPSYVNAKAAAVVNGAAFTEHIKTDGTAYCIQSTLPGGGDWCVDSKGVVGSAAITCDATNADCAAK